jgi:hypothetical protein
MAKLQPLGFANSIRLFLRQLDMLAVGLAWVSNNPCQESVYAWPLFRMFFDTQWAAGLSKETQSVYLS